MDVEKKTINFFKFKTLICILNGKFKRRFICKCLVDIASFVSRTRCKPTKSGLTEGVEKERRYDILPDCVGDEAYTEGASSNYYL